MLFYQIDQQRTYKVISGWSRNHFDKTSKRYIPASVKLLLLQFIGIDYYAIKIKELAKVVIVGDSGCGKTSILHRYVKNEFNEMFIHTIGIDFMIKTVKIEPYNEIKYQIWDTAGRERFRTITSSYWRGAHVALIVFDLTDRHTFEGTKRWLDECDRMQLKEDFIVVIVGNKTDLCDNKQVYNENESFLRDRKREIKRDEVIEFINGRSRDIFYWETSAKTGANVVEMFEFVAHKLCDLFRQRNDEIIIDKDGIKLVKSKDEINNKNTQNNSVCYC